MAQKYIGKVSICPSGDYQAGTEYKRLDVVNYQGSAYIALADNTNVLPTNATYWMLLVATGNGIASIELIETVGLVNTYRITYTNGDHYDFSITNGATKTSELDNDSDFVSRDDAVLKEGDTMTGGLTMPNGTIGSRAANSTVGTNSLAVGIANTVSGNGSLGVGVANSVTNDYAVVEGYQSTVSAAYSHAEGYRTTVNSGAGGGHAEGYQTTVNTNFGPGAHAEGYVSSATSLASHAEGQSTTASGVCSHAEGLKTTASNAYAHAEGQGTTASGVASHAEGYGTIASSLYQHVQGEYNIEDRQNTYLHIVGKGSSDNNRSNAHTIDWAGNAWYSGTIKVGGASYGDTNAKELATKEYVDTHGGSIDSISVNGVTQPIDQNKNVNLAVPVITYSTTDLEPGVSQLDTGTFYFVYE